MKKSLFIYLSVFVFVFSVSVSFAKTVNVADTGAIVDDNLDDSVAVRAAFTEVIESGGGTVVFPHGVIDMTNGIGIGPQSFKPVNITMKGDGGSIVRISVGQNNLAFWVSNLNQFHVENMVFVGKNVPITDPQFIDAGKVFYVGFVQLSSFRNSSFFGLAVPNNGSIIHAYSNITIDNTQFEGVNAGYPDGSVLYLDCCLSFGLNSNISNSTFTDFAHFNGQYLSKTPASTGSWIKAKAGTRADIARNPRIKIEDSTFDEGAATAIKIDGWGAADLRGLIFNVSGINVGAGLRLNNVGRVEIADTIFGYVKEPRPLAVITNGTKVKMFGIKRRNYVSCPQVDSFSNVIWEDSDCQ